MRSGGKSSRTTFKVLNANPEQKISLVECYPETGRSHQIRVHLEHLGHGIVGDKRYGVSQRQPLSSDLEIEAAKHQMLHARVIKFSPAPGVAAIEILAEPLESFMKVMRLLITP